MIIKMKPKIGITYDACIAKDVFERWLQDYKYINSKLGFFEVTESSIEVKE